MRTENIKRIHNEPMKSPSPDIANRNIIKDTKIPVEDIKRYLQKSSGTKSPNYASIKTSGIDQGTIQELKKRIRLLELKNQELLAENKSLKLQKKNIPPLNKINDINETELVRSEYTSRDVSPKSTINKTDHNSQLKQLQDRLMGFVTQNGRLSNFLYQKDNRIRILEQQKQTLEQKMKNSGLLPQLSPQASEVETHEIKSFYQTRIEPEMKNNESIWENRLRQLNDRLVRVTSAQNYIQNHLKKKSSIITPPDKYQRTAEKTAGTQRMKNNLKTPQYVSRFTDHIQEDRRQQQNIPENRLDTLQKQLEYYKSKCANLQKQQNPNSSSRNKSSSSLSSSQIYQQQQQNSTIQSTLKEKIQDLEYQLQKKINQLADLQQKMQILSKQNIHLKEKNERERVLLQRKNDQIRNNYEEEKSVISNDNNQMNERIERLQQQSTQLDHQLLTQINNNKQLQQYYLLQIEQLKIQYNKIIQQKQQKIDQNLHKYLLLLQQIKKDIAQQQQKSNNNNSNKQFRQQSWDKQAQESNAVTNMISQQLNTIKKQYQTSINSLRNKYVSQQHLISQLQRQNKILRAEIQQLNTQKQKLKQLMLSIDEQESQQQQQQSNQHKNVGDNITKLEQLLLQQQQMNNKDCTSKNNRCRLKKCLMETIKKIDNLELEISQYLKQE